LDKCKDSSEQFSEYDLLDCSWSTVLALVKIDTASRAQHIKQHSYFWPFHLYSQRLERKSQPPFSLGLSLLSFQMISLDLV